MQIDWVKLDHVNSTNSYLAELIRDRATHDTLAVVADYQDSGKGQGANRWHSRRGENLLMSMALFPAFLSASMQFHISRIASLAICDLMESMGLKVWIKWPNDILSGECKISGILIEHCITGEYISHSIIGIGLNLNQKEFPDFPVRATSFILEKEIVSEPFQVAKMVADQLINRYEMLIEGDLEELERDYLSNLCGMDMKLSFSAGNESFTGVIRGVSEFGELLVEKNGELRTYGFQEISYDLSELNPRSFAGRISERNKYKQ